MQEITAHNTFKTVLEALPLIIPTNPLNTLKNATEDDFCFFHFSMGAWLRDNLLSEGASLFQLFTDNGVTHADDMSGIILRELWEFVGKN